MDALSSACFVLFTIFDRILPTAVPRQLRWVFLLIGVIIIATEVEKKYRKYKGGVTAR